MSAQENRLRALLASEERESRLSVFELDTRRHPLVDPYCGSSSSAAIPCYRGRVTDTNSRGLASGACAHSLPSAEPTVPVVFPARLRPQFTQLDELNLRAIERRAQRDAARSDEDARLKARAAKARQNTLTSAAPRQARAQRQAERHARASGLQASKRMQEDYVSIGWLGR